MQGVKRNCKSCGHGCHCYQPDCDDCVNDVCFQCDCKEESKIKTTDARSWNDYLK